jgi:hypothetical protein
MESGTGLARIAKVSRAPACQADARPLNESAGFPGRLPAGLIWRLKTEAEVFQIADFELHDLC